MTQDVTTQTTKVALNLKVTGLVGVSTALVVDKDVVGGVDLHPGAEDAGAGGDLPRGLNTVVELTSKS